MKSHRKHKPLLDKEVLPTPRRSRYTGTSKDGIKRRLDALEAAHKSFWFWYEIRENDKAQEAKCPYKAQGHRCLGRNGTVVFTCWHGPQRYYDLQRAQTKMDKLWNQARKDGILGSI